MLAESFGTVHRRCAISTKEAFAFVTVKGSCHCFTIAALLTLQHGRSDDQPSSINGTFRKANGALIQSVTSSVRESSDERRPDSCGRQIGTHSNPFTVPRLPPHHRHAVQPTDPGGGD